MRRIKSNKARCNHCGDVLESEFRHDFKTCTCGKISVDGGKDYVRRGYWERSDYEELSEYESEDNNMR